MLMLNCKAPLPGAFHSNEKALTSVRVDEDGLLSANVRMVVVVADGDRQRAGHRFGGTAAVAHDHGDQEFLLTLAVERPQRRQRGRSVQVVLQVEVVAMAIVSWDGEMERCAVLQGVSIHSPEQRGCLVHVYNLNPTHPPKSHQTYIHLGSIL